MALLSDESGRLMSKQNIHDSKFKLCIWKNQMDVVYYEQLQPRPTINGECYMQQVERKIEVKMYIIKLKYKKTLFFKIVAHKVQDNE